MIQMSRSSDSRRDVLTWSRCSNGVMAFMRCIIALVLTTFCVSCWRDPRVVKTLSINEERSILITESSFGDPGRTFQYITRFRGVETPGGVIGFEYYGAPLSFELLTNDAFGLVAVVETNRPTTILIMHDFANGKSWPRDEGRVASELLKRLTNAYPSRHMTLPITPGAIGPGGVH